MWDHPDVSVHALSWALKQDVGRSSEKFVLVCLCNYADERGICYPSVAALERDTGQDRKTVLSGLKSLCESGLLQDTGQRVGVTKGVIVYQVVGTPENCTTHYTYRITHIETGEFYIGKRSCHGDPELDVYRGSGRWTKQMLSQGAPLHREIIAVFQSSSEALADEQKLFRQFENDPLCMNDGTPKKNRDFNRRSTVNGTGTEIGTVPKFPSRGTVFTGEQSQNSVEAVPKTGHGYVREPSLGTIKEPSPRALSRACRIPEDFELTPERKAVAEQEHVDAVRTFATFTDYWRAASGEKSRKHDWDATWRNWCRRQSDSTKTNGAARKTRYAQLTERLEASINGRE